MGRGFSTPGKYQMSCKLICRTRHLRWYCCHTVAFNPLFQRGAVILMDTFWASGQEGMKTDTSVLVFPWCQISFWNTDTSLEILSCPGRLLESKSPLPLALLLLHLLSISLDLHFTPFLFLLNPSAASFPVVILDEISCPREWSKLFPSLFPLSS